MKLYREMEDCFSSFPRACNLKQNLHRERERERESRERESRRGSHAKQSPFPCHSSTTLPRHCRPHHSLSLSLRKTVFQNPITVAHFFLFIFQDSYPLLSHKVELWKVENLTNKEDTRSVRVFCGIV
ncbi:hypothetical protein RIF29_05063 [Crotalaria pallida]|uniref:Uncharacterized protein n=1 Tax=Crotalaria pallida TaxID=3830 RepID=A0AAN9PA52_CROPI